MMVLIALVCGVLFGAGLTISGMSDPQRVLNFLDFAAIGTPAWDATLGVVFATAVVVMALGYALKARTLVPLLAARYNMPSLTDITPRLMFGSAAFGVGWGLAGICPGPTVAALALVGIPGLVTSNAQTFQLLCWFLASLLVGLWLAGQFSQAGGAPAEEPQKA